MKNIAVHKISKNTFEEAVELLLKLDLDTRDEIVHHLKEREKYYVAMEGNSVVGVVGWYQDTMNYATKAMGKSFPGNDAYWVGFFGVEKKSQSHGVGRLLLRYLESVLVEKGVSDLWVSSVKDARTYYEEQGFKMITTGDILGSPYVFLKKILVLPSAKPAICV